MCVKLQQEKSEMKRELRRIEDVMAGLSASKANYRITIDSVQNPGQQTLSSFTGKSQSQQFSEKLHVQSLHNHH